jgi:hypothetical protein
MLQMTTKASSIGEPSVRVLVNVLLGQVLWNDKKKLLRSTYASVPKNLCNGTYYELPKPARLST